MKRVVTIVLAVLFLLSSQVYAGDIPESIMLGKQKALFIGKISNIDAESFRVIPTAIMMGNIEEKEITVKKFGKYFGTDQKPKTGDIIVAVLQDEKTIDGTWVFKCTSADYKTLKLVSKKYDMVARYQGYINQGKYFEAQKRLDNKKVPAAEPVAKKTNTFELKKEVKSSPVNYILAAVLVLIAASAIPLIRIIKTAKRA